MLYNRAAGRHSKIDICGDVFGVLNYIVNVTFKPQLSQGLSRFVRWCRLRLRRNFGNRSTQCGPRCRLGWRSEVLLIHPHVGALLDAVERRVNLLLL